MASISVIVPTYKRESVLVETLASLARLLKSGDEILVIDQTPQHEAATTNALERMTADGVIRWYRRSTASQNEAMNIAALLAQGEILLFLDDDIIPFDGLLEEHRQTLLQSDAPPATCGQVLQPWNPVAVDNVKNFDLAFDAAYSQSCEVRALMAGNFAIQRETYLAVGGMDENFFGANYRNDSEIAYRTCAATGRLIHFVPKAGLRHLLSGGGNRAFGAKDTWGHIGGSIGDYYFALKSLPFQEKVPHILTRLVRASLNRNTVARPWLIPSMAVREVVAFMRACGRLARNPYKGIRALNDYGLLIDMGHPGRADHDDFPNMARQTPGTAIGDRGLSTAVSIEPPRDSMAEPLGASKN
jgi:glycosyltransferase involved in cell wall biosynthesis